MHHDLTLMAEAHRCAQLVRGFGQRSDIRVYAMLLREQVMHPDVMSTLCALLEFRFKLDLVHQAATDKAYHRFREGLQELIAVHKRVVRILHLHGPSAEQQAQRDAFVEAVRAHLCDDTHRAVVNG
jgi:flagellar biosynthesis regulator FlbT